ncbi:MAG: type II secretion system GspH family protein [Lachnospiraceae bacterium]|nr:type II secretion system GspH family protein [Lachnospiraceae bacterium]
MKHKIRNENNGFTLIELVITIAVLAVISVPLLMYFTDSMRHSARMKEEQNAVVAAQNVLEELKVVDMSLDDVNNLTLAVTPPPGATPCPTTSVIWEEMPGATPGPSDTPAPAGSSYEVKGKYSLNKQVYTVKAKITPRHDLENPDGSIVTYQKAKAPSMDSSKDMIITEKATAIEDAKMHFYNQYTQYCDDPSNGVSRDPSIKIDSLVKSLERIIHIKAEPEKDDTGVATGSGKIQLTATYEYKWKGSSYIHGVDNTTRYSTDIKVAVLDGTGSHNIFLFYTPIHYASGAIVSVVNDEVVLEGSLAQLTDGSGDIITGSPGTGSDDLQYRLYLVADDTDRSGSPGYKTTLSASSGNNFGSYISEVYTNLTGSAELQTPSYAISAVFPASTEADHGIHYQTLMEKPEVNRVAEIEVSVYKGDSTSESNRYTTVNGTKVQSQ